MATNPPVQPEMQQDQPVEDKPVIVQEDQIPELDPKTQQDVNARYEADMPSPEMEQPDVPSTDADVAKAARDERMRLLPEYLEHFFLEDLPPIDPTDPFNQGIYIRYRINQVRDAKDMEPVE